MKKLLLISMLALAACTTLPPAEVPTEVAAPAPSDKPAATPKLAWDGKHSDAAKWTAFIMKEIPVRLADAVKSTPKDIKSFCPSYAKQTSVERVEFYAQLVSRMIKFESNYKPEVTYTECSASPSTYGTSGKYFADRAAKGLKPYCIPGHVKDGGIAISRGLGQMSLESSQGYKCPLSEPNELHDPYKNISCMLRVMNRFIPAPREYEGKVRGHGSLAGYDAANERWQGAAAYWSVMRDRKDSESYPNIVSYLKALPICNK